MVVYLASPIASTKSKESWSSSDFKLFRNEKITSALKEIGFEVYLPQVNQKRNGKETWEEQKKVMINSDFLILVLSDTRGAYIEAGFAKALGKKVYVLEVEETRGYSDWLNAVCDYIAKDINDLIRFLKENFK